MKTIISAIVCLMLSFAAFGATDTLKCKKGFTKISCDDVKGAKRMSFCWKGKISDKKKVAICKKKKSLKRKKIQKAADKK